MNNTCIEPKEAIPDACVFDDIQFIKIIAKATRIYYVRSKLNVITNNFCSKALIAYVNRSINYHMIQFEG